MTITSQASSRKAAEIRLPFEQYHWLIFLSGCVNSSEPFLFISDTGASITVINETRATALGLTLRDKQRIASADGGEGAMSFVFAKGVTLDLVSAQFASAQVGGARCSHWRKNCWGIRITQVRTYPPAANASLRVDDVLLTINDRSAVQPTLFQIEQMLKEEGREIRLRVQRSTEPLQLQFKLKRTI